MRLWFSAAWLLVGSAAHGGDKPIYAPAPDWVRRTDIPDAAAIKEDKMLLVDWQERLSRAGDEYYVREAQLVRSQAGLDEAGKIRLEWNPATDDLVIHKVVIHRGRTVIDLLATGQKLTVLRRETGLEQSTLDGRLTGALLAEGLEVGDILETAFTIRRKEAVFGGGSASIISGATTPAKRKLLRQTWKTGEGFKWRVSRDMPKPVVRVIGDSTEVALDLTEPEPRKVPSDAPRRFQEIGTLEASSFSSWQDVSTIMAPLYADASVLPNDSPLKAEAKRILAASHDPAVRTRAALALVQDRIRYVYLGMDAGNYTPASADQTWGRKFGDCKGKTVVLLALLRELGIPASAALVSSENGDMLSGRLPSPIAFDHVIVRADVNGRTYWLDGTANDAGPLDRVETGDFGWSLPLSKAGSTLEKMPTGVPRFPLIQAEIEIDARQGTTLPVPAKFSTILSGRAAAQLKAGMDGVSPDKRDEMLKASFNTQNKEMTVKDLTTSFDPATGSLAIHMTGTANLRWQQLDKGRRYLIDGMEAPKLPKFGREDGPDQDLPVVVSPLWFAGHTTILLPDGGKGFTIGGSDFDKEVGGVSMVRKARVEGNRMTVDYQMRALRPEITATNARDALGIMTDLARSRLFLVAADYSISAKEQAGINAEQPKTKDALLERGYEFMNRGEYKLAIADMDAVLKSDPKHALALANRGIAKFWVEDLGGAEADFAAAQQLDPKEAVWMRGKGLLAMKQLDYSKAIASFSEALALDPADTFSLYRRAESLDALDKADGALVDIDALMELGEEPINLHRWRANILIAAGRTPEALTSLDKLVNDHPTDPAVRLLRASALAVAERDADAIKDYDVLIAMKPSANAYLGRARLLEKKNPAAALADSAAAVALDSDNSYALDYHLARLIQAKDSAKATAIADREVARKPDDLSLRLVRASARLKLGNPQSAVEDMLVARKLAVTPAELNEVCWWGATKDQALEAALSACDEALAKKPESAAYHDSRGLVLLRLNRLGDALAAYDRALSLAPELAGSLYGRSLVKARLNDLAGSKADRAAAIAAYKDIDAEYEEYRLPAPKTAALQSAAR